jgi:hypothetical protein
MKISEAHFNEDLLLNRAVIIDRVDNIIEWCLFPTFLDRLRD